ncbi:hypothetical protein MRB53_036641 [Persea americana]|nr:hypothetical protein MRB53_036713 [Persea americana]KAJ8614360.1 hypothetical protein MRB53_036641 [Persea americana]
MQIYGRKLHWLFSSRSGYETDTSFSFGAGYFQVDACERAWGSFSLFHSTCTRPSFYQAVVSSYPCNPLTTTLALIKEGHDLTRPSPYLSSSSSSSVLHMNRTADVILFSCDDSILDRDQPAPTDLDL